MRTAISSSISAVPSPFFFFFFFNDTATTEIYTLSLHDALPISIADTGEDAIRLALEKDASGFFHLIRVGKSQRRPLDRKSTRLNSSHANISYAVFCLKKKTKLMIDPLYS